MDRAIQYQWLQSPLLSNETTQFSTTLRGNPCWIRFQEILEMCWSKRKTWKTGWAKTTIRWNRLRIYSAIAVVSSSYSETGHKNRKMFLWLIIDLVSLLVSVTKALSSQCVLQRQFACLLLVLLWFFIIPLTLEETCSF